MEAAAHRVAGTGGEAHANCITTTPPAYMEAGTRGEAHAALDYAIREDGKGRIIIGENSV